jgi:hypothetical protein
MILLVIKITLSASLVNMENNKQIKLAKKSKQAAWRDTRRVYPNLIKKIRLLLVKRMGMTPHQKLMDFR